MLQISWSNYNLEVVIQKQWHTHNQWIEINKLVVMQIFWFCDTCNKLVKGSRIICTIDTLDGIIDMNLTQVRTLHIIKMVSTSMTASAVKLSNPHKKIIQSLRDFKTSKKCPILWTDKQLGCYGKQKRAFCNPVGRLIQNNLQTENCTWQNQNKFEDKIACM